MTELPQQRLHSRPESASAVQRHNRASRLIASLLVLALVVALTTIACSEPDAKIVFISDRDGNDEIYLMNAAGAGLTQLTDDAGSDFYPSWSPDGQRVLFISDRDGDDEGEIYLANADGSDLTQLAIADSYQGPRDERPVLFSTTAYDGNGDDEIYIMNPDGSGLVRLTDNTSRDFAPDLNVVP
ncbi:MAG: hypothetical protein OXC95_14320 [Dehalococcoidia bacterium]|nr:hypothetical protein [Dehalococcoidia bacterium]